VGTRLRSRLKCHKAVERPTTESVEKALLMVREFGRLFGVKRKAEPRRLSVLSGPARPVKRRRQRSTLL